jgi:cysteine-rich repeat protein
MLHPSTSAFTLGTLVLIVGFSLGACGGETDLNFVGPSAGGSGGSSGGNRCGNGVIDPDEECDDDNDESGDGCTSTCALEDGWTCEGEPSVCVGCGNEKVEGTEECDDGNTDDDDGCSATCTIEGSCEAPTLIELEEDGDGFAGTVTASTSESDLDQVPAAPCGSSDLGGGADRIFEFELTAPADVEVRVGANFDAIVRVMSSPCDPEDELPDACVDDVAVSEVERAIIQNAPAGVYYVVVDGKSASQAGTFSVDVDARCPLEGLKINRVTLEPPFRTEIVNTNATCAIDLSRVGIRTEPEASDTPSLLPDVSLGPLARRELTSESPPPSGKTYQGNLRYDLEDNAGAFYLCRGACASSGSNVIDAFRWEGTSGPLSSDPPADVAFDENKAALSDPLTTSYWRVQTDGAFPDFTAEDYEIAHFVETFEVNLAGWSEPAELFYQPTFESPEGTIGTRAYALNGGNPSSSVWNGPEFLFKDNAGDPVELQPSAVSLWVRGSDKTLSHGHVFFGQPGNEDDGFGSLFRDNGTLGFGSPSVTVFQAYDIETWYFIEYKDFDYSVPGSETVDVYVDGVSRGTLSMSTPMISQLSLRNLAETTVWVDQIIVK